MFSFLFLKGECRYCGTKLSFQYPLVEFTNGILYVILFAVHGINFESLIYCFFVSALLTLSVIDFRTMELPLGFRAFILCLGVAHAVYDYDNWVHYVIGFFAASLFLLLCLLLTRGKGIGGGDIKLMAVAGLMLGWQNMMMALVVGCVIGSVL